MVKTNRCSGLGGAQAQGFGKVLGVKEVAVSLCAPTGRATKRLTESTGLEARTIQSNKIEPAVPGVQIDRRGCTLTASH